MSARRTSPHNSRPGSSRCPGFMRKKVTVRVACTTAPSARPVVPSRPLGTSTASTGLPDALMAATTSAATPSSGLDSPAPNSASTMRSAPAKVADVSFRPPPPSASATAAASPVSRSREPRSPTRTRYPCSRNSRAATKPSPPLFPGPHTTAIAAPLRATRSMASSATARPAASMRESPGTPAAIASASARPISSAVSSSCPCTAPPRITTDFEGILRLDAPSTNHTVAASQRKALLDVLFL